MATPLIPTIINAGTTLVLAALQHFTQRKTERAAQTPQPENPELTQLADSLQKRLNQIEESDVEQARLISELSQNLQKLALAQQADVQDRARRDAINRRLLVGLSVLGITSLAMSAWALGH